MTSGRLYRFLADDHQRLDALLDRALSVSGEIDAVSYTAFRAGLLRHIGIEEKILMPAAQRQRGGEPLPIAAKIRLDHGALVALMVPPPSPGIIATIRAILTVHNEREEESEGLYETCEGLAAEEADAIFALMEKAPEVPVLPHNADSKVLEATRRAVERAGYSMK